LCGANFEILFFMERKMNMRKPLLQSVMVAGAFLASLHHSLAGASDFIENMPELQPDTDRAGGMIWEKPGFNRAAYDKVFIEPVTIFISPNSDYKGLNADELKALADGYQESLVSTLEPEIAVVSKPGPGVLYIRSALVDVKLANKKRGLLGYTPVGLVVTTAANAAGMRVSMKEATLEVELLDGASGERLGVLVDKAPAPEGEKDLSWDSISKTFVFYASRFKARMQAAK
jgi:hypothetical protein